MNTYTHTTFKMNDTYTNDSNIFKNGKMYYTYKNGNIIYAFYCKFGYEGNGIVINKHNSIMEILNTNINLRIVYNEV